MRVVAIIQARLGSTRLPGKVLRPLAGEPMLARVVERVRRAKRIHEVVVATTDRAADDPIAEFCQKRRWPVFRGSETDVLDRYVQAARTFSADAVVRITSDCPLIDPGVLDLVVSKFVEEQPESEYLSNTFPRRTFPRGLDLEVIRRDVLERCHLEATGSWNREHVTALIYQNPDRYRISSVSAQADYSGYRWTVDTPEDLVLIEKLYSHFGHDTFSWQEALAAMEAHPDWLMINSHVEQKAPAKSNL